MIAIGLWTADAFAQGNNGWTIGASIGALNIYGDVTDYESFDPDGMNLGGALSADRKIGRLFVPQLQLTLGRLSGSKTTLGSEFETFYADLSVRAGIDLIGAIKENAKLELVPFGGVAAAYYDPLVTRTATGEEVTANHINQGETFGFGLAFGGRLGYSFNERWKVFGTLEMRYMFTDQVDGYEGLNLPANESSSNDWLSYIGIGAGYTLGGSDETIFEEPEPLLVEETPSADQEVNGQFTYNGLPKSGVQLELYDENDKKLASTTTDLSGNFKFKNLKPDRNYIVKLSEDDKGLYNGGKLYILNDDKERIALANKPEFNNYTFTQMKRDEVNAQPLLVEDKPATDMEGVFVYEDLPAAGVKVYLMDEDGNRMDSTVTRSDGSFKFNQLNPDQEYFVKLDEEDAAKYAGADMYFLNDNDEPVLKAGEEGNGTYAFKAIEEDELASLDPLTDDGGDLLYRRKTVQTPPEIDLGVDGDDNKIDGEKADDKAVVPSVAVSFEKETIYFRHNSFWISDNQKGTKGSVIAQKMKDNPNMRIRVEGWASPPGDADYNMRLSQKRADTLKDLLVNKYSINSSRIDAVGKGEVSEKMSEEEARRAKIVVIK